MTRQATDQLYIELDYYTPEDYYVYTAEAVAAVSSTATISCSAGKIVEGVVDSLSLFTVGVTAFITTSASTDLSVTVVMSVNADKVITANITLETIVTLSLQADKIKGTSAALTTTASVSATAIEYESYISTSPTPLYALGQALITTDQSHFGSHSLFLPDSNAGAISASIQGKFHIGSSTDFSIAFWYYPTANTVGTFDDIVSWYDGSTGWFVQRTSTRGIRFFITDGTNTETDETGGTATTLNAWNWVVVTRTGTTLEIYVNGTQRAVDATHSVGSAATGKFLRIGDNGGSGGAVGYLDGLHITVGSTISTATPTEDTLAGTANSELLLNWNGTWFDQSNSSVESGAATLSTSATVSGAANKLVGTGVVLNSTATVTAQGLIVAEASADLSSVSELTAAGLRTRTTDVALTSEFTVTASAEDLDLAEALLSSTSTLSATATVTKQAASGIASTATVTAQAQATKSATATLAAEGFVVAVGLDLDLASAQLVSTATLACSAIKTVTTGSTQISAFTQTAQPLRILQFASAQSSAFTLQSFETRLKDVFVNSALGQVYFRNTLSTDGNYSVNEGDKFIRAAFRNNAAPTGLEGDLFAIAFWASGNGYIWQNAAELSVRADILLNDSDQFVYRQGTLTRTWSGIDTLANNHYLLYDDHLYVNGQDQGAPTVSGSGTPRIYRVHSRYLGFRAEELNLGEFLASTTSGFQGAVAQYVMWAGPSNVQQELFVPDFTQSSERQKLYNNGYVDIGSDGTATGLFRPWDYFKLENYTDLLQRGAAYSGSADWRILGGTFVFSGDTYRSILAYTATEEDDTGPFAAISTLTAAAISVFVVTANLNTTATVTATANKLIGIIESLDAAATVTTAGNRLRFASADLTVTGSELVIAVKTGRTLVDCAVVATMTTQARADFEASASLNSTATVACNATAIKSAQALITSQFTTTTVNGRLRDNAIAASTVATLTATARKDTVGIAQLQTTATLTGSPFTTHNGQASLTSNVQVTANAIAGYIASSNMSVTATLTVSAARTRSTTAAFTAFNTQLTIGTKITLDPYYQLVVARELSVKKIQQETGILTVDAENRLNTVQAENATLYVPSETSIYHIPYSLQVGPRRVK